MPLRPKTLKKIRIKEKIKSEVYNNKYWESNDETTILPPYQKDWIVNAPKYPISVWEKSRRIGASFCDACLSVMNASREVRPRNTYYISYNKDMTEQYIKDCGFWASIFNLGSQTILDDYILKDEDKDILVYRIRFSSGKQILSLSSAAKNLRSKQGDIVVDESAFLDPGALDEIIKAGLALTMLGGSMRFLSTHNGINSEFNKYIEASKDSPKIYIQRTTFMDAIGQGYYKNIAAKKRGEDPTEENEQKFISETYEIYKHNAAEELDVIPKPENDDQLFKQSWFNLVEKDDLPSSFDALVRAWDTASTDKEESCYTVGTLLGLYNDCIYVLDWTFTQSNAKDTQNLIINTAKSDGTHIQVFIELEGGSQALMWLDANIKAKLPKHNVNGIRPIGSKLMRAVPAADKAEEGLIYVLDSDDTDGFIETLCQFTGKKKKLPLINDAADSFSLGVNVIEKAVDYLW